MLLIDRVVDYLEGSVTVAARLEDAALFRTSAGVHACTGMELMAQAAAACFGLQAMGGKAEARPGMLVACRDYRSSVSHFPACGELLVGVQTLTSIPDSERTGLVRFSGQIFGSAQNNLLASGTLSVYL
jgi:predicted hotdog family 3-hydroxylacyl-ACP dehydratase